MGVGVSVSVGVSGGFWDLSLESVLGLGLIGLGLISLGLGFNEYLSGCEVLGLIDCVEGTHGCLGG